MVEGNGQPAKRNFKIPHTKISRIHKYNPLYILRVPIFLFAFFCFVIYIVEVLPPGKIGYWMPVELILLIISVVGIEFLDRIKLKDEDTSN
jgi:hypothetical protein